MHRAVHVGGEIGLEAGDGIQHRPGSGGGRRVVQVDQGLIVHPSLEQGKLAADRVEIEGAVGHLQSVEVAHRAEKFAVRQPIEDQRLHLLPQGDELDVLDHLVGEGEGQQAGGLLADAAGVQVECVRSSSRRWWLRGCT